MSKKFGRGFSKMLSHFSVESTMDQEFNVTKERADEAERKLHGVVSKISRLKSILLEAAILQVDISLSLSEIASGDKNVVEEVNAFGDKTLNDVSPKIVREITRLLMSEGCGCLMINQKNWNRLLSIANNMKEGDIVECCEIITPTNRSSSNTTQALPKVNTIFNARATYNYNARDQSELTLREGDWVTVLSTEGDWWEGEKWKNRNISIELCCQRCEFLIN
ncbi:hypothetical protein QTN25_006412 [Entamoeba marina]